MSSRCELITRLHPRGCVGGALTSLCGVTGLYPPAGGGVDSCETGGDKLFLSCRTKHHHYPYMAAIKKILFHFIPVKVVVIAVLQLEGLEVPWDNMG
jgi:hypothetical protein